MLLLASLLLLSPPPSWGGDSTPHERVTAALARIPAHLTEGNAEELEDSLTAILGVLYQYPTVAARLLTERLEPAARGKHRDHPVVVWYIRALRSLTGLDFTATTRAQLADSEAEYLQRDSAGTVHFFGWHMAWDDTWLAPQDAQFAIIRQWRAWFAKRGRTFRYVNDPKHDHWYY